ncbi:MAG: hypothetical protein GF364_07825, partial [Candidatus Lokiarchaeota archaeon]|nr:hypothetical protein [Candidatus Lokiarchaeota archaeon]
MISFQINVNGDLVLNTGTTTPHISQGETEPTYIDCDILDNHSVVWFRAYIVFNVTSDADFTLYYNIWDANVGETSVIPITAEEVEITAGSNEIKINIKPAITEFPGKYYYNMKLYYYNNSGGIPQEQEIKNIDSGEIRVVLGATWLLFILTIVIVGLLIVLLKEEKLKEEPEHVASTAQAYTPGSSTEVNEVSPQQSTAKDVFI